MKTKLINGVLGAIAAALLFGLIYTPTVSVAAGHIVPIGKTTEKSSQLVLYWNEIDFEGEERESFLQVTNTSDTPVNVHIQLLFIGSSSEGDVLSETDCTEINFFDFYTPNDTHVYEMDEIFRNDPLNSTLVVSGLDNVAGFMVVTPIDGPGTGNAIAHQHMIGKSYILDDDNNNGFGVSAMGRDAVSIPSGAVVADGTVLDGVTSGFVLIQPKILMYNYLEHPNKSPGGLGARIEGYDEADIISISFRDNYDGPFGGYAAEPGDAVWTPLIFTSVETALSCRPIAQNCVFSKGTSDEQDTPTSLWGTDDDFTTLCPEADGRQFEVGWMFIEVSGLEGLENELGIYAQIETDNGDVEFAGAAWMFAR